MYVETLFAVRFSIRFLNNICCIQEQRLAKSD